MASIWKEHPRLWPFATFINISLLWFDFLIPFFPVMFCARNEKLSFSIPTDPSEGRAAVREKRIKSLWVESLKTWCLKTFKLLCCELCVPKTFFLSLANSRSKLSLDAASSPDFYSLDRRAFSASKTINPFVKLKIQRREEEKILKQRLSEQMFRSRTSLGDEWKNFLWQSQISFFYYRRQIHAKNTDATWKIQNFHPLIRLYCFLSHL